MDLKVQAFYEYEKFQKSKIGKEYRPMGDADYFAEGFLIGLKADGDVSGEYCPICKSDDLVDIDDHYTKCCKCGFSFVG